jgi:hypothetical protein
VLRALEPYVPTSNEYRTVNHADQSARRADPYMITDQKAADVLGVSPHASLAAPEIITAEIIDDDSTEPALQPATSGQLSIIGRQLAKLGVGDEDRRGVLDQLAGRDLTDGPLTQDEAAHIRVVLSKCADRGALIELLATGQLDDQEQAGGGDEE